MKAQKNTMAYMALTYGSEWARNIDKDVSGSWLRVWDNIDGEFADDPDWKEATNAEEYWGGIVELGGIQYWIASEYATTMSEGVCFLVPRKPEVPKRKFRNSDLPRWYDKVRSVQYWIEHKHIR